MKRYAVTWSVDATMTVVVDANNEEEAREKSSELAQPCLCHYCAQTIDMGGCINVCSIEETTDKVVPGPRIEYRDPEWISMEFFPPTGPVLIVHENDDGGRWVEAWEARCWHRDRANIRPDTPKHLIHAKGSAWMWAPKLPGETMLSYPPALRGGVTEAKSLRAALSEFADIHCSVEVCEKVLEMAASYAPPAAQAQDAGPMVEHWREAMRESHDKFGTCGVKAAIWIEQRARALAAKEAK